MGVVRKTMSIATLGIIPFRGKKEQLRRAEAAHRAAESDLARERGARSDADKRVSVAEKRAVEAELQALQVAKRLGQAKAAKKGKGSRRDRKQEARALASEAAVEARELGRRARKRAEKAADEAKVAGRKARRRAHKAAEQARRAAEQARHAAEPVIERAAERATATASEVRGKVEEMAARGR